MLKRTRRTTGTIVATLVVAGATYSASASARTVKASKVSRPKACRGPDLPRAAGPLPWQVGEELSYKLSVSGIYVGRMDMKVGKPRRVDGKPVLTLFGRARTNSFAAKFKTFLGRYMSFIGPKSLKPVAVRVESRYGEDDRWERVRFTGPHSLTSEFRFKGHQRKRSYARRQAPLYDLLSILYYGRTRALQPGLTGCQEVYLDRRLWRMDSEVRGLETIMTPAGRKQVFAVVSRFERLPHRDFDPSARGPSCWLRPSCPPTRAGRPWRSRWRTARSRVAVIW